MREEFSKRLKQLKLLIIDALIIDAVMIDAMMIEAREKKSSMTTNEFSKRVACRAFSFVVRNLNV
jgi:hypothetical protein